MSLKKMFQILLGIQFGLGVGLAVLTFSLFLNQKKLSQSQDTHFQSYLLADELRQSSDDLTRLARTYVATGDEKYEQEYWAVLDVRNGKIPRPVDYNRIYWDFISGTGQKPRPDGATISLQELMIQEGFTDAELEKLSLSHKYSDELVKTEKIAMNAVKGLFDDGTGNFRIKKTPNRALAIRLMNDAAYHKHKVAIMRPIDEFYTMFAIRTFGEVVKYERRSMHLLVSLGVLILVIMGMFGYSFVIIRYQISKREQAEEALGNSEKRFQDIADHTQEWIWEVDTKGRYTYSNPTIEKVLGYSPGEIVQKHFYELIHPDDMESLKAASLAAFATKQPFLSFVNRKVHKHGQAVWFETSGIPMFDEEGLWLGYRGADTDITERRRTEDAMKASEAKYGTLFGNSRFALMTLEPPSWSFASGNSAAVELFGMKSEEEFTRCEPWVLSPERQPDGRASNEKAKEMIETAIREGSHFFDWTHRRIDGEEFPATVLLTRVDQPGKGFLQATVLDITERKRAEESIRKSEERFRAIYERAPIGVALMDSTSGQFLKVNPMYCEIIGYSHHEMLTQDFMSITHAEDLQQDLDRMSSLRRGESNYYKMEKRYIRKNGTTAWVQLHVVPLTWKHGIMTEHLAIVSDINERKRAEREKAKLEAQIQQIQKMESVGRLAGGVAHDFNNMLGVIIGHSEMALSQIDPAQPLHEDLTEILNAAERSASLTRQLLAFARKQTAVPRVIDLNQTVTDMLNMLKRLIGEDIHLHWHPMESLWTVKIDPSQIDQILANLCVNARDAVSGVGKITIETGNIHLGEDYCAAHPGAVTGDYIRLVLSDNGCGIDKETLAQIFEPFFTTKGIGKGTGLGLSTVYGIVKQNNGFINVYSEMEHGTTFTIYLPRYVGKADQEAGTEEVAQPATRGQETILLVEDELSLLKLTQRMLEKLGYTIITASTPGEAICLAKEHRGAIHLLVTDVVMPEMNGRDLAKNLLSLYPQIKQLFISGYTADVISDQGVLDEGVHFIQKPFALKSMATKIREVLDKT